AAGAGSVETTDEMQERALAGAGRPHDGNELARRHAQVHAAQGLDTVFSGAEYLVKIVNFHDQRADVRHCFPSFFSAFLTYIALLCILNCMKLNKDLVAASAVPLILSILEDGENYGYALIQRTRELSGGAIEWTDGMLYPVLHRLEAQGYVRARWAEAEN